MFASLSSSSSGFIVQNHGKSSVGVICVCPDRLRRSPWLWPNSNPLFLMILFRFSIRLLILLLLSVGLAVPASAVLNDNAYDGNIYALYAGNGSLVPPSTTLADSMASGRTAVIIYYLDDSTVSKRFAPVVSELQRFWGRNIDLMPLTTDALQGRETSDPNDPAHYWKGTIPQVTVINADGQVVFDRDGQVPLASINAAISGATGLPAPDFSEIDQEGSFNEVNVEVNAS